MVTVFEPTDIASQTYYVHSSHKTVQFAGVIYLHDISSLRFATIPEPELANMRVAFGLNADIFKRLSLVTTMWNRTREEEGNRREAELKDVQWKRFLEGGSAVDRFLPGHSDEARKIVYAILRRAQEPLPLIQDGINKLRRYQTIHDRKGKEKNYGGLAGKISRKFAFTPTHLSFITKRSNQPVKTIVWKNRNRSNLSDHLNKSIQEDKTEKKTGFLNFFAPGETQKKDHRIEPTDRPSPQIQGSHSDLEKPGGNSHSLVPFTIAGAVPIATSCEGAPGEQFSTKQASAFAVENSKDRQNNDSASEKMPGCFPLTERDAQRGQDIAGKNSSKKVRQGRQPAAP